jgi:hypothetical protein
MGLFIPPQSLLVTPNIWQAAQTISFVAAGAAMLTLADVGAGGSTAFAYPTSGASTTAELTLTNNLSGLNVLVVKNSHASGFSAIAFRGSDGVERGAFGFGNASTGAPFTSTTYFEASYYDGSAGSTKPPPLSLVQTGWMSSNVNPNTGGYSQYIRLSFDADGNWAFYRPEPSTHGVATLRQLRTGQTYLFANPTSDDSGVFGIRADSTSQSNVSTATSNSSLIRLEQLGNAAAFLIYNDTAFTNADGMFRIHLDNASASAPALTLRHDGTGPWFGLQANNSNTNVLTVAYASGASVFTATGSISLVPTGVVGFGGLTSSFPALKRSSAVLQARLGDDSGFAALQGALRTAVNAVTGLTAGVLAALTNATIVVTDAAGQDYRIPCII